MSLDLMVFKYCIPSLLSIQSELKAQKLQIRFLSSGLTEKNNLNKITGNLYFIFGLRGKKNF